MKQILDTHTFLWWDNQVHLLSPYARQMCEDTNNTLYLSLASVWEMQIKHATGKLEFRLPLAQLIESQQRENGLKLLPIKLEHLLALDALPMHHKDPFDRLLIVQAQVEKMTLLSIDTAFSDYDVDVRW